MEGYKPEKEEVKSPEANAERLTNYLEMMAEDLKKEGIPVTNDCRIDIDAFDEIYNKEDIEKDEKEVSRLDKIFARESNMSVDEWNDKKPLQPEEQLEILTTIAFHKNLGPEYLVVRSSKYDDYINNVDNLIIHRKTGKVVCAFDEVTNSNKENKYFNSKKESILEKNNKEGAEIKYGVTFENESEEMRLERLSHIPIFHLSLSEREIEKELWGFNDTNNEKELFENLSRQIRNQIKSLAGTVSEDLRKKWMELGDAIKQ